MMRRLTAATIATVTVLVGCRPPTAPTELPDAPFGAVAALIDGRSWVSTVRPDSVVAFYTADRRFLQVTGLQVRGDFWPALFLQLTFGPGSVAPGAGAVPDSVTGLWFDFGERGLRGAFQTVGRSIDSLELEELDHVAGRIRGAFLFTAPEIDGSRQVHVRGRFAGRLLSQ